MSACPPINRASCAPPLMLTASGKSMRQTGAAARQFDRVTVNFVAERVIGFLRDRHPTNTAKMVARDTAGALPVRTIDKWLERVSSPNARAYTVLWLTYGPEFLAALSPTKLGWLDANVRAARAAEIDRQIAALEAARETL